MKQMAAFDLMSQRLGQLAGQSHLLVWLRNLLVLLLLLSACFSLSKLFWLLLPAPSLPEVGSGTPKNILSSEAAASASSGGPSIDIAAMVSANLFGKASAIAEEPEKPQVVASLENAVETRLNLVLKGVMLSSDADRSFANIASGREEKIYAVGDRLPGGSNVKLQQVLADRIILINSGRSESLMLFEAVDFGQPNSAPVKPSSSQQQRQPFGRPASSRQTRTAAQPAAAANETRKIKRVPKSLAEVIKFSIAREQGEIVGYKIRPGRDKQAFADLGLQTNDIVTDINGIALNSSGSITKVYREMRQATSASVTLLREGQSYSLNLQLDSEP